MIVCFYTNLKLVLLTFYFIVFFSVIIKKCYHMLNMSVNKYV